VGEMGSNALGVVPASHCRSRKLNKHLVGCEMMAACGMPVFARLATAAQVNTVPTNTFSENSLTTMAGNSMHVPCVGFAILAAMLCTEAVH
jgi:hypothetical protein